MCAFEVATPNVERVLILAGEEARHRVMAGARGISSLTLNEPAG
jgi:hypothetical protein